MNKNKEKILEKANRIQKNIVNTKTNIKVYVLIQNYLGEIEILGIFINKKDAKTVKDAYDNMQKGWNELSKAKYYIEEYVLD